MSLRQPGMIDTDIHQARKELRTAKRQAEEYGGGLSDEAQLSIIRRWASKARCPVDVAYRCIVPGEPIPEIALDPKDREIAALKAQLAAAEKPSKRTAPKAGVTT